MKSFKASSILFILLLAVWVMLTGTSKQELLAGIIVSFILAFLMKRFAVIFDGLRLSPALVWNLPLYIVIFVWEIIKSNIDVALRVINPRLPINPGIVKITTNLKSDIGKLALANSITLTPGTLTVDVRGDDLYIHCIDAVNEDVEKASKRIAGRFESVLKGIFK